MITPRPPSRLALRLIISHRYQCIFWKPHKVASTSVMVALGKQCSEHDCVGGVADQSDLSNDRRNLEAFSHLPTGGNHATPGQIRPIAELLWGEELWPSYFKFTIVRNPWERAVSWLDYSRNELGRRVDLESALANTERDYWFDTAGEPLADAYIRYERLDEDYQSICERLDIPHQPLPRLRVGQRDRTVPYWEYYDESSRDLIARAFDREIEYFDYRFGE
jgi:hypothetical protein